MLHPTTDQFLPEEWEDRDPAEWLDDAPDDEPPMPEDDEDWGDHWEDAAAEYFLFGGDY